jgi:hypothetical protein
MSEEEVPRGTGAASPPTFSTSPSVSRGRSHASEPTEQSRHDETESVIPPMAPTMGVRKLVYRLTDKRLPLSKQELRFWETLHDEATYLMGIAQECRVLEERIESRVKIDKVNLTLVVANQVGHGSKTTTATYLVSAVAKIINMPTAYIECRRDSAVGLDMLGVDSDATLGLRELHSRLDEVVDGRSLLNMLSQNGYGVSGIKADESTPEHDTYDEKSSEEDVRAVQRHNVLTVIDTGNNPSDKINIGMAKCGDIGIFPTLAKPQSFKLRRRTMDTFRSHGLGFLVENSIHIINGLGPNELVESYRSELAIPDGTPIYSTMFDEYIASEAEVDLKKIKIENYLSVLRILVAAYDMKFEMDVRAKGSALPPHGQDAYRWQPGD